MVKESKYLMRLMKLQIMRTNIECRNRRYERMAKRKNSRTMQTDTYRRIKKKRAKQRRRAKICKLVSIAAAATLIVFGGMKFKNTLGNTKNSTDYAAQEDNNQIEVATSIRDLHPYPTKSTTYEEITSETVKSPYVALLDVEKNEVIAGRDSDEKIIPASMTKVMTLIVAVEHLTNLEQKYTMTAELITPLIKEQASRAGFDPGEEVSVEDLLYGLILPSGADAAEAIAQMTAGSNEAFAELMNQKCVELGLTNTNFVNPSGLYDQNQYTTPVEMAMIFKYAMQNATCEKILSTYQHTTAITPQHPQGILLTSTMFSRMYGNEVPGVTIEAGKTGYVDESGNCLVSYAGEGNRHFVAVTAGATNRWHVIYDDFDIYANYTPQENE